MARTGARFHAGAAPYGLRPVKVIEDGRPKTNWALVPGEAQVAREMYLLAVEENLGYKSIADRLAERGHRARNGMPFASFSVQYILTNPALKGQLVYGRRPRKGHPQAGPLVVDDFYPAILSEEEWGRLQERQAVRREHSRGRASASSYFLGGIARCGHCGGPMVGKVGARRPGGGRYRNYWCSRAMRSRALCPYYNGHSAPRLEKAILDYLGQFSDPAKVKEYLALKDGKQLDRYQGELAQLQKHLGEMDSTFLRDMDRLDRGVLNEAEFVQRNRVRREMRASLESRKGELVVLVERERGKLDKEKKLPRAVKAFLQASQGLEVRQAKAQLQLVLKAAHIFRDGRIELEFRG